MPPCQGLRVEQQLSPNDNACYPQISRMPTPESARQFMSGLIERARKLKKTIAFPEGNDPRVLEAASRLARDGVVRPVLIGAKPEKAPEGVEFVDTAKSPLVKRYADLYYERRRAKGITQVEGAAVSKKPLYFASLMV